MGKSRKLVKTLNKIKKLRSRKIRAKKIKSKKYKKQKKQLLIGGWDKTDPDFIAHEEESKKYTTNFVDNLLQGLLLNINKKYSQDFKTLNEALRFIKTLSPGELTDDFNYDLPKFSIIPKGTVFYRRQKTNSFDSVSREIWLDYTGTISLSPFSYLKDTNKEYTPEYLTNTIQYFGEFLMKFEVNKDLLILHFPLNVSSYSEFPVRYICTYAHLDICVDGYTLDYLKYNPNDIYNKLPSLNGYRELCILNARNVDLVESISTKI